MYKLSPTFYDMPSSKAIDVFFGKGPNQQDEQANEEMLYGMFNIEIIINQLVINILKCVQRKHCIISILCILSVGRKFGLVKDNYPYSQYGYYFHYFLWVCKPLSKLNLLLLQFSSDLLSIYAKKEINAVFNILRDLGSTDWNGTERKVNSGL